MYWSEFTRISAHEPACNADYLGIITCKRVFVSKSPPCEPVLLLACLQMRSSGVEFPTALCSLYCKCNKEEDTYSKTKVTPCRGRWQETKKELCHEGKPCKLNTIIKVDLKWMFYIIKNELWSLNHLHSNYFYFSNRLLRACLNWF